MPDKEDARIGTYSVSKNGSGELQVNITERPLRRLDCYAGDQLAVYNVEGGLFIEVLNDGE